MIPGRKFDYPKSLYAVEDCLRFFISDNPDAVVLDFFAGSGTTAHAVMRLNRQDGGRRQSISITNNEVSAEEQKVLRSKGLKPGDKEWDSLGICEHITKPRITAAITGKTPEGEPLKGSYKFADEFPMAEGFEENVEFFTLTYEDSELVKLDMAFAAVDPLLWLRAGGKGSRIVDRADDFAVADHYAVLFTPDARREFLTSLTEKTRVAYIVTDSESTFSSIAKKLPEHVDPVQLYSGYLKTFEQEV